MRTPASIAAFAIAIMLSGFPASAATPMVSSSSSHSLALREDGTVVAWGSDRYGALGTGRPISSNVAVKTPGLPRIVSFSAADDAVAAVDGVGQVWTWGPGVALLGPRETSNRAVPARIVGLFDVVQVDVSSSYAVAVRRDGKVVCWAGCPTASTAIAPGLATVDGLDDVVKVAVGQTQLLALRRNGTVMSLGANLYGDVGDGTKNVARTTPFQLPLANIVGIAAGLAHSVALRADGKVFWWGSNYNSVPAVNSPVELTGLGGEAIAVGADSGMNVAVRADGTVWRWDAANALEQVAGYAGARAVGSVDGAGEYFNSNLAVVGGDGFVRTIGFNSEGQLGNGAGTNSTSVPVTVSGLSGAVAVRGFRYGFAALTTGGEIWSWGANGNILGNGVESDRAKPSVVPGLANVVQVAAGQDTSYAVTAAGTVYAWGSNVSNKLGRDGPSTSTPTPIPAFTGVARMAAGSYHALFVKTDGSLWQLGGYPASCSTACAVRNRFGQAFVNFKTTPGALAAGNGTSYAVANFGQLFAWGANALGQIGKGDREDIAEPWPVSLPGPAAQVSTLRATVLALVATTPQSSVYAWGDNIGNAAGPGGAQVLSPQLIAGFANATAIASGFYHSLALRADGVVLAMGNNARGELGDGTTTQRALPVPVADIGAEEVISLSAGEARSFGVRSDGLVYAWGAPNGSGYGNLADGTFVTRNRPVVAISERGDANLDDTACTQSVQDRFWYLDLDARTCFTVPAAKVPKVLPVATYSTGSGQAASIETDLGYRRADWGTVKNTYVLGVVPAEFLDVVPLAKTQSAEGVLAAKAAAAKAGGLIVVQRTAAGWSVVSGPISAYATAITDAERRSIKLLEAVPAPKIAGAQFCVGYGDSVDQMLQSQQLRVVATIPGTEITVTLPCLLAGTYLNGPESSLQGQNVTFGATVVGEGPTGTVQFTDNGANLGGPVSISALSASLSAGSRSTSTLAAGDHAIRAAYSGDANLANPPSNAGPLTHRVVASRSATTTSLSLPARSLFGAAVSMAATVAGAAPTGAVAFRRNGFLLATVNLSGGVARYEASGLGLGTHGISADYAGDSSNLPSNAQEATVLVYNASTEASVSLTGPTGPIAAGTLASFTVDAGSASGTVSLRQGTQVLASAAGSGGPITLKASFAQPGVYFVYAHFQGGLQQAFSGNLAVVVTGPDPDADSDGDGMPNGVEIAEGRNPAVKDNDVFADARLFAMQQYRDFLGREGDVGGVAFWSEQVASGARSRAQGVENFFLSPEFQQTGAPVARLYFAYFLRIPDYGGLMHWMGQFRGGTALDAISEEFARSEEFAITYGALGNGQFVERVYRNVLGRAPEAAGLEFWTAQLESGARSRGQVMTGFSESEEYRAAIANETYVTMMYAGMLRRAAEPAGFAFWVDYLDRGNSGLALIDGFLSAPEYRNRFLP